MVKYAERIPVVKAFSRRYRRATKKQKTALLKQLREVTGYDRKYLSRLLKKPPKKKKIHRRRVSPYQMIKEVLTRLWAISNYACGQRLVPLLPVYLESLVRHQEMKIEEGEKGLLLRISSSTIDRLLKAERQKINLKGRSRTKPGTLLKHQIPIRTFADWSDARPGFVEIDSVHHCGNSAAGDYLYTLNTTDVATGWNECRAHLGKAEIRTIQALETIRARLPFPLLGIDFDTGGEFVNWHLIRWSKREKITYTRAREGKKNDQNYVEQQNYSVVRRFVGYRRLDKPEQLILVNQLYEKLSDYQNFFQSVMRLKEKVRNGTRLTRRYQKTKTAYQRVLERSDISGRIKRKLRQRFLTLNPLKLIREITEMGQKLSKD